MRQQDPTHQSLHVVLTGSVWRKLREVLIVLDMLSDKLPESPVKV